MPGPPNNPADNMPTPPMVPIVRAPPRGVWLRAIMAELERIANHLGDFGAIDDDSAQGGRL